MARAATPAFHGVGTNDGVKGESTDGNAVHGISANGSAIYSEGDLYVTGAYRGDLGQIGGAPFPRPAYDSGWISMAKPDARILVHGLGGDPNNYVVDVQFQHHVHGRHHIGYGGITWRSYYNPADLVYEGGDWYGLDDQQIIVTRAGDDDYIREVRVRIWVYE